MKSTDFPTSDKLHQAALRLTGAIFNYHRVGFDRRSMTFLGNGSICQGARQKELFWKLTNQGSAIILEIFSTDEITCRLEEDSAGTWRGRWQNHERMPVELSPLKPWNLRKASTDESEDMTGSLFIISLPRSLSTQVYHVARNAVGLQEPAWTTDGEILNLDRFCLFSGPRHETNKKFLHPDLDRQEFSATSEFLDQVAVRFGHAYKDVVQPFVVTEWAKRRGVRTLRIRRNIADIAYAMLRKDWGYPARLLPNVQDKELALIKALVEADDALASVPAQCIDFDDLIEDDNTLSKALQKLFPGKTIQPISLIDEGFKSVRKAVLARRSTEEYQRLCEYNLESSRGVES